MNIVTEQEVSFWRAQVKSNQIIQTVRAFPNRAIQFFGALDVHRENIAGFLETIDAYKVVLAEYQDVLKKLDFIAKEVNRFMNRAGVATDLTFTNKDVRMLKTRARQHLLEVHRQKSLSWRATRTRPQRAVKLTPTRITCGHDNIGRCQRSRSKNPL